MEDFEREVVGRIPKDVPKVDVDGRRDGEHDDRRSTPVVGRRLVGRSDNAAHPDITVDISLIVVQPATAGKPVPVMVMFRGGALPGPPGSPALDFFGRPIPPPGPGEDPPGTQQLIEAGWGYAFLNPSSVQADNGAGLTKGIIGLVNKGQPRKPDDWGSLRAWALGREPRARLLRDRPDDRRQARRHRRRVALRQGGAGDDGLRSALRGRRSSARPARAAPSCTAATSARPSRTSPPAASTTGWPATS